MALRVLAAPPVCTVQDLGRSGLAQYGVSAGGALDWLALAAANRLVGNPAGLAGLEWTLGRLALRASQDCLVAAAGHGFTMLVGGRQVGLWRAALLRHGELLECVPGLHPGWAYLAVAGGLDVPPVMGSRSTNLRGGFGGWQARMLQDGDELPLANCLPVDWQKRAGRLARLRLEDPTNAALCIPAVAGPQQERFTLQGSAAFWSQPYSVSALSDRMGYRLVGPVVQQLGAADVLSEGLLPGCVQVPGDGQPIVLMQDGPTTGGYAKIATVTRLGLALLAQAMPGWGVVRFQEVTLAEAQASYRAAWQQIEALGSCNDRSEL